jgi:hypothetical protein
MGELQQSFRGVPKTFLTLIDLIMEWWRKIYLSRDGRGETDAGYLFVTW